MVPIPSDSNSTPRHLSSPAGRMTNTMIISLFATVLLLQLAVYLVNAIGAKTINELAWQFSARLPLSSSKDAKEQMKLRQEVLQIRKKMNAVSAQDDFARWAKIRREYDKVLAAHDKKGTEVSAHRNSFDTKVNIARWILTSGLKTFLQFWHAKTPVFSYPQGWLPWPVEWILAFPRCPYGTVSINVWSIVCGSVIAMVGDAVLAVMQKETAMPEKQKVAVGAEKRK